MKFGDSSVKRKRKRNARTYQMREAVTAAMLLKGDREVTQLPMVTMDQVGPRRAVFEEEVA